MAVNKILFKELPFRPEINQVFYIENGYDRVANDFIRSHYIDMKSMFESIGMEFYYLPYLLREHDIEAKVRYYAPYLSPKLLVQEVQSNALVPYISDAEVRANLKPSFIFMGREVEDSGDTRFFAVAFDDLTKDEDAIIMRLRDIALPISETFRYEQKRIHHASHMYGTFNRSVCREAEMPCPSEGKTPCSPDELRARFEELFCSTSDVCYAEAPQKTQEEQDEERSLVETAKVLHDLWMTVQKLRLEGVSLMAIHEFIDKQEPLSRMAITSDYRIFLPDYNNMEIEMGALPKAIYFLFLRYPEGIIYKHMPDHYNELLNIYKQLRPNTDDARLNLTITKVVNPLGNALNENIARIRKAFVEKFDEHLANNYIITGERGLQYSIPLDRDLITWEE